jgi:hypothetical protein
LQVLLPSDFGEEHRYITLQYLQRGHELNRDEWRLATAAFDMLKNAVVLTAAGMLPFPLIYRQYVEELYATPFIEQLLVAKSVERVATQFWAQVAGQILDDLMAVNLFQKQVPATRLLLAYCLYWWRSFTLGYALEVEIQRDLGQSGIEFQAHDLLKREERLSPYDISVLGFKGDIKTSLYFLQAARSRSLAHDFYITKVSGSQQAHIMVVFMQRQMWQEIDGDTLFVLLEELADNLPQACRIIQAGVELTVIDYELWKAKVQRQQKEK